MAKAKRKKPAAKSGAKKKRGFRWGRWLAVLVLAAICVPIVQVAAMRWVDPPVTPLMVLRWAGGKFSREYAGGIDYRWRPLEEVPQDFVRCVWTAEDQRFFEHNGIDWKELDAARARSERTGEPVRGASTITMQCARSLFLWQGRSWVRKGIETYYTVLMEWLLPKRRIMELYVNVIEMGDGIYGIEAAAGYHYGKPAVQLTRSECAMLAALLPYPRGWDPRAPSPRLAKRHRMILRRLGDSPFPAEKLK